MYFSCFFNSFKRFFFLFFQYKNGRGLAWEQESGPFAEGKLEMGRIP